VFKRNFLTGLLVTLPIAAALWIFIALASTVDEIFPDAWRPRVHGHPLPGLGVVAATFIIFMAGLVARNIFGQQLLRSVERAVEHIPLFGKTYGMLKQVTQAVLGKQREAFRHTVLVRFPHPQTYAIGFVTGGSPEIELRLGRKILAVYVPTTPNPTSGYYLFVPEDETIPLELPVEQALKLVVTMGIAKTESGLINLAQLSREDPSRR
jgi:uncharacterized membrane protein